MGKMKVVVVTGLSGAGKTNAMDWFEDRGFYCVDNMPPALIANLSKTVYQLQMWWQCKETCNL